MLDYDRTVSRLVSSLPQLKIVPSYYTSWLNAVRRELSPLDDRIVPLDADSATQGQDFKIITLPQLVAD